MSAQVPGRGQQLASGGWTIGVGPQWLAHAWSGGIRRIFDAIDGGLVRGSIRVVLPDGTERELGGRAPGFDALVRIHSMRALLRLATGGSVGWYQAWEAGEWDSPDPVQIFAMFMDNAAELGETGRSQGPWRWVGRAVHWLHRNTRAGSLRNIHAHYDLGNDFYAAWLDPTMSYSSALYGEGGDDDLEGGQRRKVRAIAERLDGAGSVLEIGCGWGALARHLADNGARVTAISLSEEQLAWARERHGHARIDFRKQDYRDVEGQFDGVASVEMVEAVGQQYWPAYFDCIARCLKKGGRAAIQFISMREDLFDAYARGVDFIQTYVFPGGILVRESAFQRLAAQRGLIWDDRKGFGLDYARTLRQWRENFNCAVAERRLPPGFDQRFVDFWRFYLMYCEGGFRGGGIDVAQVTLVKQG